MTDDCHVLSCRSWFFSSGDRFEIAIDLFLVAGRRVVVRACGETNGRGVMPAFKDKLSTADIANVAAYVSTVAGK